jgi:membrane protein
VAREDRVPAQPSLKERVVVLVRSPLRRSFERIPAPFRAVVGALYREVVQDRVTGLAAESAFYVVLAVFPGLLVLAAALGSLELLLGGAIAAEAQEVVVDTLRTLLTERAAPVIDVVRDLFTENRRGVVTLSVALSVWAMTRGFAAVIRALNLAYDLDERRPWLEQRLVALLLSLGSVIAGALVLAAFVSDPLLGGGRALADALGFGEMFVAAWNLARWPLALGVVVVWAASVYRFAPNRHSRFREEMPGAFLTAVFALMASAGLNVYLTVVESANPVLGSLGGGLILLVWLYVFNLGLLIGGELNAIMARESWRSPSRPSREA